MHRRGIPTDVMRIICSKTRCFAFLRQNLFHILVNFLQERLSQFPIKLTDSTNLETYSKRLKLFNVNASKYNTDLRSECRSGFHDHAQ